MLKDVQAEDTCVYSRVERGCSRRLGPLGRRYTEGEDRAGQVHCRGNLDVQRLPHPDDSQGRTGAPIMFKPTMKVPEWADTAPALAGLVGYTDAQIVTALSTHVGPKGTPMRPPMPPFRLTRQDAEAVAAYLRTLKPAKPAAAAKR
jgi:hypothetical protein